MAEEWWIMADQKVIIAHTPCFFNLAAWKLPSTFLVLILVTFHCQLYERVATTGETAIFYVSLKDVLIGFRCICTWAQELIRRIWTNLHYVKGQDEAFFALLRDSLSMDFGVARDMPRTDPMPDVDPNWIHQDPSVEYFWFLTCRLVHVTGISNNLKMF